MLIGISFTSNKKFLSLQKEQKIELNDDCLLKQWYGRKNVLLAVIYIFSCRKFAEMRLNGELFSIVFQASVFPGVKKEKKPRKANHNSTIAENVLELM